jgi:MFS family permease
MGGIIGGPIIDRTRAYKGFILITLSLATIGTTIFTLVLSYAQKNMVALSIIIAFVGLGAAGVPAILEATIETIYPGKA